MEIYNFRFKSFPYEVHMAINHKYKMFHADRSNTHILNNCVYCKKLNKIEAKYYGTL